MKDTPLAIVAAGMVTGVGLDAPASCAAIRAGLDNFQETRFVDAGGEALLGCEVPLAPTGDKQATLLAMALEECAQAAGVALETVPVLLCLSERERPGRADGHAEHLLAQLQRELGRSLHAASALIQHGRVGAAVALRQARQLIYEQRVGQVIVAAVDSLLDEPALRAYEQQRRLLTSGNGDGFIPGEAASAVLVARPAAGGQAQLLCLGLGYGVEPSPIGSGRPLRADGLVKAIQDALAAAGRPIDAMDFRLVDVSGEHYWFKESSLALLRTLRQPKEPFDIWHPADCVGEVGAAIGPLMLAVAKAACEGRYSAGDNILCHFSNLDGRRAAAVLSFQALRSH